MAPIPDPLPLTEVGVMPVLQELSIAHQKVSLQIDFASRQLVGSTEITINPFYPDLKYIRLNCRQCKLLKHPKIATAGTDTQPAGFPYTCNYIYDEPYSRYQVPYRQSVHQYKRLHKRVKRQLKSPMVPELVVEIPKKVHIKELVQTDGIASQHPASRRADRRSETIKAEAPDPQPSDAVPQSTIRLADPAVARYTPLTLTIDFVIKDIRDGLQFVGLLEGDNRYPHAYTRNSPFPGYACTLFPCIDNPASRPTWEISIKCARTLGQALTPTSAGSAAHAKEDQASANVPNDQVQRDRDGDVIKMERSGDRDRFSQEDAEREMVVVCSGDLTDEVRALCAYFSAVTNTVRSLTPRTLL